MSTRHSMADTTSVTVRVSGELTIPLQLGLLHELQDPALEAEVMQEAIKVSVSEQLGHFDAMQIELDAPHDGQAATSARVTLELEALGRCIGRIQAAYDHMLAHAKELRELLLVKEQAEDDRGQNTAPDTATGDALHESETARKDTPVDATNRARMLAIVETMLSGPTQIVQAAAALDAVSDKEEDDGEAAHGLLAHEERRGNEEAEEERYARLGYTRL